MHEMLVLSLLLMVCFPCVREMARNGDDLKAVVCANCSRRERQVGLWTERLVLLVTKDKNVFCRQNSKILDFFLTNEKRPLARLGV